MTIQTRLAEAADLVEGDVWVTREAHMLVGKRRTHARGYLSLVWLDLDQGDVWTRPSTSETESFRVMVL